MNFTPSLFDAPPPAPAQPPVSVADPAILSASTTHTDPVKKTPRKSPSRRFETTCLFEETSLSKKEPSPRQILAKNRHSDLPFDFSFLTGSPDLPEYYRVRRKAPYPPVLDDVLLAIVKSISIPIASPVLCEGTVFPALVGQCSTKSSKIVYVQEDIKARKIAKDLITENTALSFSVAKRGTAKFSLIVACLDDFMGKSLADKIISFSSALEDGGLLLVASPADYLLDYTTNVRNEAPLIRDALHKKYKTHFILRPTGPLMEPSWDVLVLSRRPPSSTPVKNKWRITGTGFLPWQKCNEAISSSPWLLVESSDQIPPAVARCVNYPWESFEFKN